MRVLQICHKIPFPPNDGGTLATYQLTKAMLDLGWSVKLLGMSTAKHPFTEMPVDPVFLSIQPEHVRIDTRPRASELIKGLWSNNNHIVNRFNKKEFANLIAANLTTNEYDLIVFEGTFTASYVDLTRRKSKAILMMRSHNVEFQLWEDRLFAEKNTFKRFVLKPSVKQLREFELNELKKFDVVATISMNDKAYFNSYIGLHKTIYVPFGISLPDETVVDDDTENRIIFLGALDWEPNIAGLRWFLNEVWPLIQQRNNKLKFHIGGRNADPQFAKNLPEGVIFEGEIQDAHSFILAGKLMVVPLFEASGIRIKIIEGLALGQVIATTTKGAQGIPAQNGKDILIADTPKQMAREIVETMRAPNQLKSISKNGRILAENKFDITNTQKALLQMITNFKK
ncbi:MAG: glycosyltransferase involved in cell wall biosynthesis [Salibacteraceae bacterium]|jgi:glycosyltransferase involved in cell wall biosynthesis